jgi:hypothetical protein
MQGLPCIHRGTPHTVDFVFPSNMNLRTQLNVSSKMFRLFLGPLHVFSSGGEFILDGFGLDSTFFEFPQNLMWLLNIFVQGCFCCWMSSQLLPQRVKSKEQSLAVRALLEQQHAPSLLACNHAYQE